MPRASFPCRRAATTPISSGSIRAFAESCHWTGSTSRGGCRERSAASLSRSAATPPSPTSFTAARDPADRQDTWINGEIIEAYTQLHHLGFAHSVECWQDNRLAGGLYGVALGGAFCGESMFTEVRDASKVALVHLIARLRLGGFTLLDTQFVTEHLKRFGAVEIPAREYLKRLDRALGAKAVFYSALAPEEEDAALADLFRQSRTQTS